MSAPSAIAPTAAAARTLAAKLFVLGFPLILLDAVRRAHPLARSTFHRLPPDPGVFGAGLADEDVRTVLSSAMIDLADGPCVLHLPDVRGRYITVTLIDAAGEAFAALGSRTETRRAGDVVLVGPHGQGQARRALPALNAPSDMVWAVSRIVANALADIPAAEALAARQWVAPLAAAAPIDAATLLPSLEAMAFPLAEQVAELAPETFLHRLTLLAQRAPAHMAKSVRAIATARLVGLGELERAAAWPDDVRRALAQGFSDGLSAIAAAARAAVRADPAGWSGLPLAEASTPLARAARCHARLGAPMAHDVLTLRCARDESGRPLTGEERYRLHFPAGALPPTEAAWRLAALPFGERAGATTAHGAVCDRGELMFDRDGALDLTIQSAGPDTDRSANWLQSPPGRFRLIARLYWPGPAALGGAWRMPPVERLGSRSARRSSRRGAGEDLDR